MLTYEVNVTVEPEAFDAFRAYLLDQHMQEVVEAGRFVKSTLFVEQDTHTLVVQYEVNAMADMDRYLSDHAPRMRDDAIARFGGKFTASRRFLEKVS